MMPAARAGASFLLRRVPLSSPSQSPSTRRSLPHPSSKVSLSSSTAVPNRPVAEGRRRRPRPPAIVAEVGASSDDDGARVSIRFDDGGDDDEPPSLYGAPWLRSNDPRRVVLPSGQRSSSTGGRRGRADDASPPRIVGASIELLIVGGAERENDDDDHDVRPGSSAVGPPGAKTTARIVPGPTPGDCCHPLAVYGGNPAWMIATAASLSTAKDEENECDGGDEDDESGLVRPYLVVEWADSTTPATTPATMTMTTTTGRGGDADDVIDGIDGIAKNTTTKITTRSIYDVEWLMRFRNDDLSRAWRRRRTEVQPAHAIRDGRPPMRLSASEEEEKDEVDEVGEEGCGTRGDDGLARVDYRSIVGEDGTTTAMTDGVFALLHSVFRDGAVVVSDVPTPPSCEFSSLSSSSDEYPVARVAMAATSGGRLSHGALYGDVFHVRAGERDAINAAYTSDGLRMHQDLAYYESPPGLQFLHCVANGPGVDGGESTLIDGMAAAYRLRELRPDSFETLVRCPATFVKQRDGACMTYRRPHIVLADDEGEEDVLGVTRRRKGDPRSGYIDRQIVAVHWSPPFEGPVILPPRQIDRYYEAYADFERILNGANFDDDDDDDDDASNGGDLSPEGELSRYAKEFTWERKLIPGEMLVFNNRRMLHGRRGFSAVKGASFDESQRHLVGCYTNIDDTLNLYRVLLRERECASTPILNVGNGTSIIP